MNGNKRENYLDELLHSVSAERSPEELEMLSLKSQLDHMRNAGEHGFDMSSSEEDRFVQEFERELEQDDYKSYIDEFEREIDGDYTTHQDEERYEPEGEGLFVNTLDDEMPPMTTEETFLQQTEETFLQQAEDPVSTMINTLEEDAPMAERTENTYPETEVHQETENTQPLDAGDLQAFSEIVGEVNGSAAVQELPRTEDGEVDLSGNSGMDLMDILEGDESLSDLGGILSGEDDLGAEEQISDFADQQMQQQSGDDEDAGGGKKKRRRRKKKEKKKAADGEKTGLFAKIAAFFFGPEEEEKKEDIIVGLNGGSSAEELSDENKKILSEMDGEGKKKKKKKEKPKKEKKEKPPKEKKPKKEKPKKEKKEKPKDNTPPLPRVPVIMIFVMAISIVVLVLLGTNVSNYSLKIKKARKSFKAKEYETALEQLKAESIKEDDEKLYNQLTTLAAVSSKIKNYEVFKTAKDPEMAFDSIVCAAGRYVVNLQNAKDYECKDELDALRDQIATILEKDYHMEFKEAAELYDTKDRLEYTNRLLKKLKELGKVE